MTRLALSPAELRLLLMVRPGQAIHRPAFRGRPFRLAGEVTGSARSLTQFDEALVMGLVGRGLLTVTQCAKALPLRDGTGATADRPFGLVMSREGERQRALLVADRARIPLAAANDAALVQGSAAA